MHGIVGNLQSTAENFAIYIRQAETVEWPNWRPLAALDVNENKANWLTANRKTI